MEEAISTPPSDPIQDEEHEPKDTILLRYFLQEWQLVKSLLDRIVLNGGVSDPSDVNKIRSIMDKYQQEGQLLEPYLESIISPLMSLVRSRTVELGATSDELLDIIKPLCIIIYTLVTVSGYKNVVKFFPHQVSDLELAVALFEKCHRMSSATSLRQESTGEMETKCIVLLWLYILVLIPFDISSVDTSMANSDHQADASEPVPLVVRILEISKDHLSSAGPMRRMSGLLLARLLTRPDMSKAFHSFMEWTHEVLLSATEDFADHFRLLGVVEALAYIFKVGSRKVLFNVFSTIWNDSALLMKSTVAARSPLLRKFVVKLSQSIGLTCLPHRPTSWRYLGKSSSLHENLSVNVAGKSSSHCCQNINQIGHMEIASSPEEEDMDVPEIIEDIIELLLSGLRDPDTIVRWSSAKGIGRVTARLTSALSQEVLSSILELFSAGEGDSSWHGGCLALAELARRGLLLPVSLPKVLPVIIMALHYDIRRGPHSIGSHVRDAAAYVCWAFGRAYSNSDMKGILEQLAPHLLMVACYDREVNCRRAASAAFQENVGRQGTFPHGIDIVNIADYFSLSSRSNSYLHVAVCIAQYKEYLYPFVEELLYKKINHWEKTLRELAAEALSALARYDCEYFSGHVLEKLIPCTLSSDLCTRHGATLAAGELVLTLHQLGFIFSSDKQKALSGIVPAIEKARLYRGKGGEIMRSSVCRFIECISLSAISLTEKAKRSLLDTLNENLKHPNAQIQCAAVDALKHFIPTYLVASGDKFSTAVVLKYLELLDDPNVAARRGAGLALGILPHEFLALRWEIVITRLCSSCTIEDKPDDPDAEARVNAVRGLISVCETLSNVSIDSTLEDVFSMYSLIKSKVIVTFLKALDDYTVDNRGDVGSWIREAAMEALERCSRILCKRDSIASKMTIGILHQSELQDNDFAAANHGYPLFDTDIAKKLVAGLAKQAVEKMDKIRDVAAKTLQRILYNQEQYIPFIPHRKMLEDIVPSNTDLKWGVPTVSYPCFVQLLGISCYSGTVLSGLVISVGGLQESLQKASVTALLEYLQASKVGIDERKTREAVLSTDLLWVLQQYQKSERVITATFKTIDVLLSKKVFLNMEGHSRDFFTGLLDSLAIELKVTKDFTKLCAGLSILGYISSQTEASNSRAFSHLLSFLGHRYPKIRKTAADQVYLVLLQNGDLIAEDNMDRALEIISDTCWEGAVEEARSRRSQLYELAGLEAAACKNTSGKEKSTSAQRRASVADENKSYSSLVGFSGF